MESPETYRIVPTQSPSPLSSVGSAQLEATSPGQSLRSSDDGCHQRWRLSRCLTLREFGGGRRDSTFVGGLLARQRNLVSIAPLQMALDSVSLEWHASGREPCRIRFLAFAHV